MNMLEWLQETTDIAKVVGTWTRIFIFMAGLIYCYFSIRQDLTILTINEQKHTVALHRIERYLSSQDPAFYQTLRNEDQGDIDP